jgi:hypothetical protein
VTNTGAAPITLTGCRMDGRTVDLNVALPMVGVTSTAVGGSVVYVKGKFPAVTLELDPLNYYP